MKFGISLLPGVEPGSSASFIGGDLVVIPKGSKRVDDAVDFMKFLLSDEVQVEGYAKLLNLTTRSDMTDNQYFKAEPLVQDVAKALAVGQTPYTLKFFELINSPQGPWLQMLQRAYYTDDRSRHDHRRRQGADEGDRGRVAGRPVETSLADDSARASASERRRGHLLVPADMRLTSPPDRVSSCADGDRQCTRIGQRQSCSGCSTSPRRSSSCWPSPPTRSSR